MACDLRDKDSNDEGIAHQEQQNSLECAATYPNLLSLQLLLKKSTKFSLLKYSSLERYVVPHPSRHFINKSKKCPGSELSRSSTNQLSLTLPVPLPYHSKSRSSHLLSHHIKPTAARVCPIQIIWPTHSFLK